jgi:hypothetical protein
MPARLAWALALLASALTAAAAAPPAPPPPPAPAAAAASPAVDFFRRLLAASPADRERLLAGKSAQQVRVLTNSIRTYLALPEAERERRLQTLEVRALLTPLLRLGPAERAARLQAAPAVLRPVLEERLAYWDRLPTNVQHQVLQEERATRFGATRVLVAERHPLPPFPLAGISPERQAALMPILAPWTATTPARQREAIAAFTNLFESPADRKSRQLDPLPLSPEERALIEKALEAFRRMDPIQRQACVTGFRQFAELTPAERVQFLRNAEAWQRMSPEDRQRWRDLVNQMPSLPPLPPGFGAPTPPPVPRAARPPASSSYASNAPPSAQ